MTIPPIDLRKLILLLKGEGRAELSAAAGTKLGAFTLFREWENIITVLEKEIVPLLRKGCDAKSLLPPAQKIMKSSSALAALAAELLSFVPGPVGIICSLALAIGNFAAGNIAGGFFELLGCIPGGKVAGKSASKLFPKIEKVLVEIIQSNGKLKLIVESTAKSQKIVIEFFEKHTPKVTPKAKPEIGYEYGVRSPHIASPAHSGNMPSLDEAMKINMSRESKTYILTNKNYYYPESTNSILYRLRTNTGKNPI